MCRSIFCFAVIFATLIFQTFGRLYIDDFRRNSSVEPWFEHSDTMMAEGKSKASLVLHEAGTFRRAILFTMLNPQQTCGAAVAGIKKNVNLDLYKYKTISLKIRGQGQYSGYGFFLKQHGYTAIDVPSYVHYFEAPLDFEVVHLPIKNFRLFLEGKQIEEKIPLNKSTISAVGIVAYGGVRLPKKQRGVAALEIEWIKLT